MKRLFDVLIAALLLLMLLPVICLTALVIYLHLGRPIAFRQTRPGLDGKAFQMIKFRTMTSAVDASGIPLPDEQRLSWLGRLLRSSSLDELPELWNVLKGEMSLVGPRPLLMEYLPLYTPEQARRHEVRPGITGWAQVNGRNAISWEEKFQLDMWYVDNHTLWLDIRILWMTVISVFSRHGINAPGQVTMHKFSGSRQDPNK